MTSNTSRIAKNTVILYFRQIIFIVLSLYTVRLKLEILGVEDFGIYNIVAGLVVLFSFFSEAMTNSTQRFLNFALANNNLEEARDVFSVSIIIHFILAFAIILIAETFGLWFFNTMLNIPYERRKIALIVYQFSIITTAISFLRIPYQSTIIAYEKMSFLSLIGIIESLLKLIIVLLLKIALFDKLAFYSFLIFIIAFIILISFYVYCRKMFEISHFRYRKNKSMFVQIAGFSGWNFFGSFSNVSVSHVLNVIANVFYGVIVNAAIGIATQVNNALYQFITNLQTAYKPQIVMLYASKNNNNFLKLVFQASKISYYLLFILTLPLLINTEFVLYLWLKNVPDYSIIFTRLLLFESLISATALPLGMAVQATGNIKNYQIIVSCFMITAIPLSLLFLWLGYSPVLIFIIKIVLVFLMFIWRLFFLKKNIGISIANYISSVVFPIFIITIISSALTLLLYTLIPGNILRFFVSCFVSTISIITLVFSVGINSDERKVLIVWLKKFFHF